MSEFVRSMPVLEVSDLSASMAFYRDQLGFDTGGTFGEPPAFCIVNRGTITIALDASREGGRQPQNQYWAAYLYVTDVEALHREYVDRGVEILRGPEDTDYGCRDFDVRDPDGHIIAFGQDLIPSEKGPGL